MTDSENRSERVTERRVTERRVLVVLSCINTIFKQRLHKGAKLACVVFVIRGGEKTPGQTCFRQKLGGGGMLKNKIYNSDSSEN